MSFNPQHWTTPSSRSAQLLPLAAVTATNDLPLGGVTTDGASSSCVLPQHSTTPSERAAQVWKPDVLTWTYDPVAAVREAGAAPQMLFPQHCTTPSLRTAHVT